MADIPEDVKLEQLLELREQLREQIDQLNADTSLELSNSMRKVPKYHHLDRCQTRAMRKAEKHPNSCTTNGCTNDKIAKISFSGVMEDEKNEQPSCSSEVKKLDEKDYSTWTLDIAESYRQNLHQYPFRYKSALSSDIADSENESKKLSLHSKIDETTLKEVSEDGTLCTTTIDDIPVSFTFKFNPFFLYFLKYVAES